MHGDEHRFVQEAFETNWVSTVGANINKLEEAVCEYTGSKYAVALSAGTAALHMSVKLAGVNAGSKVFCSDVTFAATVNPVVYENGEPVFIDSEFETWNMDPDALDLAFRKYRNVKTVIFVNLYGTPAKIDEIKAVCRAHYAMLIEDAAESFGAVYKGKQTGTFGRYNVISFNGNKIITTSGGGMLLTDDKDSADRVRKWSTQSREAAPWYQHEEIGYNYRMSNIVAGIGRGQMLHLDEHIRKKKEIYLRYKAGFADLPLTMNPYIEGIMEPNFWLSCILMNKECTVDPIGIMETLAEANVESRPIWKPMHMQPVFRKYDFVHAAEKPVSEELFSRGLCLPSDIKMTADEQDKIIEIVKSFF